MKRVITCGDFHCGHKVGLTPPEWQYHPQWKDAQAEMWRHWEDKLRVLKPIDVLICNGDLIDGRGERSGSTELLEVSPLEQCQMAVRCIAEAEAKHVVITYGCFTAGHRVLKADLSYEPVENLEEGDQLLGFDEQKNASTGRRYWNKTEVLSNTTAVTDVYKVTLSDGSTLTTTGDHPYLVKHKKAHSFVWRTVSELVQKHEYFVMPKAFPVWESGTDFASGYLSGFFDADGALSQRVKTIRSSVGEFAFSINGYQNDNESLERVEQYLKEKGFDYGTRYKDKRSDCYVLSINGGLSEKVRFLGQIRPPRLLAKLDVNLLGMVKKTYDDALEIEKIEHVGQRTIYQLQTTSKTYVAEGFLCHNTPYHAGQLMDFEDEIYRDVSADEIGGEVWVDVEGVTFNVRHKVGGSVIPHGRHTQVERDRLWNILWNEHSGHPKADVILRSHVHYFAFSGGKDHISMTLPALQGLGSKFGVRQCSGTVDFGFVHWDCQQGGYSWQPHIKEIVTAKPEVTRL